MVEEYRKIPFTRVNTVSILSQGKKNNKEKMKYIFIKGENSKY